MKKDGILPGLARTFASFSRTLLVRVYEITKTLANLEYEDFCVRFYQGGKTSQQRVKDG
jgi:hypothetical protein